VCDADAEWHLATQVLYFVGAVLVLFAELFARVQLCCDERKSVYWALAIIVLISGRRACDSEQSAYNSAAVDAGTINALKARLDKFWMHQAVNSS